MVFWKKIQEIRWSMLARAQRRVLQLAQRSGLFRDRPIRLFFPAVTLHHLGDLPSWVYKDIFVDHCYRWWGDGTLHNIVDLGANIGLCSLYFTARYRNARITAVEANPQAVEKLRMTLSGRCANVKIVPMAVAATEGRVPMWIDHSSASRLNASITGRDLEGKGDVEVIYVHSISLEDILPDHVDLLKVDIEGAEYDALISDCVRPNRVNAIVLEAHDLHLERRRCDLAKLRRILVSRGYRCLEWNSDPLKPLPSSMIVRFDAQQARGSD